MEVWWRDLKRVVIGWGWKGGCIAYVYRKGKSGLRRKIGRGTRSPGLEMIRRD